MGIQQRLEIAEMWTLDELWQQFELNLSEYRPETGLDADTDYNRWLKWYAAIYQECKRRGLQDEWEQRIHAWKEKRRACQPN